MNDQQNDNDSTIEKDSSVLVSNNDTTVKENSKEAAVNNVSEETNEDTAVVEAPSNSVVFEFSVMNPVVVQDLEILLNFAKEELFTKTKFLFRPDDLNVGNRAYNLFVKCCKEKLQGIRKVQDSNFEQYYLNFIWTQGTRGRPNLIQRGLTSKRSAVQTYMAYRFAGK